MKYPATLLTLLLAGICARPVQADTQFDDWPKGWVESYKRFEAFIAERDLSWPKSGLELRPNGEVESTLRSVGVTKGGLELDVYHRGVLILGVVLGPQELHLLEQGRDRLLPPGQYAAFIQSTGLLGYQIHFPIIRFEMMAKDLAAPNSIPSRKSPPLIELRELKPPSDTERLWPNERMQLFRSYHIFPHQHPDDIHKANAKVDPSVALSITKTGVIKRGPLLDPKIERLLRWRVYHDGELIDKKSAQGQLTYKPTTGIGSYSVCLVVEGSDGIMPVSNLLEFPRFPIASGGYSISANNRDGQGIPDFLEHALETMRAQAKDASIPMAEVDAKLLELWGAWSYQIDHPDLFTIPLAKEAEGIAD